LASIGSTRNSSAAPTKDAAPKRSTTRSAWRRPGAFCGTFGGAFGVEPVEAAVLADGLALGRLGPLDEQGGQHEQADQVAAGPEQPAGDLLVALQGGAPGPADLG